MKQVHNNPRIFFLCLAGLIFIVHMIIPHDHHNADSYQEKDSSCTEKGDKPITDHGFPWHCRAFNDLLPENILKLVSCERNTTADFDFTSSVISKLKIEDEPVQRIFVSQHFIPNNPGTATVSLRAPPAV